MKSVLKITCPSNRLDKAERVQLLFEEISKWLYSEPLSRLILLFDGKEIVNSLEKDINKDIAKIKNFAKIWDFRNGKERWEVKDEAFIVHNRDYIMEQAETLGLKSITDSALLPDYILPLGGARLSNYVRPMMTKKFIDKHSISGKKIVALSGYRPISDVERSYVDEYALNATTEFEAINKGLEKSFEIERYKEDRVEHANLNLCSAIREYEDRYRDNEFYSLAAPSSDPDNRRANSYDTFQYFLEKFAINKADKLLLVTSCIYVPFQLIKIMPLALELGFEVDAIGSDLVDPGIFSKPSNFLQEIKGTIDAIYELVELYL